MKRDVFISYKSTSLPLVEKLAKVFQDNDITCWYAPRDLNEAGLGLEFDDEIAEAIKNVSTVVVLLNDQALQSKWVKREVHQAEKFSKRILPFVLEQVSEAEKEKGFWMHFDDLHMIEAYPQPEEKFPLLVNNVQKLLGKQLISSISDNEPAENNSKPEKGAGKPNAYDLDYEEGIAFLEADEEHDAFIAFLRSAEHHNPAANEHLFKIMLRNHQDAEFLDEETWEHIEELSDSGEGFADLLIHYRYFGMGTQNDLAIKYLQRALDKQVSPYAFLQMGLCYGWGMGRPLSDIQSLHYYRKAYEAGCDEALRYLGQTYLFGCAKTPVDYAKAEEYLKEGAKRGVMSCYDKLATLYLISGRAEEMLKMAQRMVKERIKGCYTIMGEYYLYSKNDTKEAKKWFRLGAENNEKQAWGNLCWISKEEEDYEEAFRLAKKGIHEHDSWSYFLLGQLYELDRPTQDLDKAWDCYMTRTHKYGTNAEPMANMYLLKGYNPGEEAMEELKHYLRIDAQQLYVPSIIALLKIMLKEQGEEPELTYETVRLLPDVFDLLNRGAEISNDDNANTDLQYIYGRMLIGDNGKHHDPFKGLKMILTAAKKGQEEAIEYIFDDQRDEDYKAELAHELIKAQNCPSDYTEAILEYGKDNAQTEEWLAWYPVAIDATDDLLKYVIPRFKVYNAQLNTYRKAEMDIPETVLKNIRRDLDRNYPVMLATGCIALLREHIDILLPDFDPAPLFNGDLSDRKLFSTLQCLTMPLQDMHIHTLRAFEKAFYAILVRGLEPGEKLTANIIGYTGLDKAYTEMLRSYRRLYNKQQTEPIEPDSLAITQDDITPCCTIDKAVEHMQRALTMVLAAHKAYHEEVWEKICQALRLADHQALLDIADSLERDSAIQDIIKTFVNVYNEAVTLIYACNNIRTNGYLHARGALIDELNLKLKEINKKGIRHHLQPFTEESILPL